MKRNVKWIYGIVVFLLLAFLASATVMAKPANEGGSKINNDIVRIDYTYYAKPGINNNSARLDPGYSLMGVKWLVQEDYYVNLSKTTIPYNDAANAIQASVRQWDDYTDCTKTTGLDLFGAVHYSSDLHYGVYDNKNTLEFGPYSNSNVIAITSIWYSKRTKSILEYDMLFNNKDYTWSVTSAGNANSMDLQNIATHELGHAIGLNDIYKSAFNYVTMYGYSSNGDIQKRTLAAPDIAGLQSMYGGLVQ